MNLSTKIFAALMCMTGVASAQSLPPGYARVMSIYQDRSTNEPILVAGYGAVVEYVDIDSAGQRKSMYLVQTVSHLSQGSYDTGYLSGPARPDGRPKPIPKLLIEIKADLERSVFLHHADTPLEKEFTEIVKGQKVFPAVLASYFETFRDLDLMILDVRQIGPAKVPALVTITVKRDSQGDVADKQVVVAKPLLGPDWRWSHIGSSAALACPVLFPSCVPERPLELAEGTDSVLAKRLLKNSMIAAEYDSWLPFATNPGMSGLPVFKAGKDGAAEVVGLISGSSPQTLDTWLSHFDPEEQFTRWTSAVQAFAQAHQYYKVYGYGDFIWMMSQGTLSRVGENLKGIRFQESRPTAPLNGGLGTELRCQNGGGFRHDNGGGFRQDNGGGLVGGTCIGDSGHGRAFVTQLPKERPSETAFMTMAHPTLSLLFPPTATGLGYYYLQSNLSVAEEKLKVPAKERLRFDLFKSNAQSSVMTSSLSEALFRQFANQMYKADGNAWKKPVAGFIVDKSIEKSPDRRLKLLPLKGEVSLKPTFDNSRVSKVQVTITTAQGNTDFTVDYLHHSAPNSITNLEQQIVFGNLPARLNLAGLLMENPEYINMPDLDLSYKPDPKSKTNNVVYKASRGDEELRSLFTMTVGSKVYYFTIPW